MLLSLSKKYTELCNEDAPYAMVIEGVGVRQALGENVDARSNTNALELLLQDHPSLLRKLRVLNLMQLCEELEVEAADGIQILAFMAQLYHPQTSRMIYELDTEYGILICKESYQH